MKTRVCEREFQDGTEYFVQFYDAFLGKWNNYEPWDRERNKYTCTFNDRDYACQVAKELTKQKLGGDAVNVIKEYDDDN